MSDWKQKAEKLGWVFFFSSSPPPELDIVHPCPTQATLAYRRAWKFATLPQKVIKNETAYALKTPHCHIVPMYQ